MSYVLCRRTIFTSSLKKLEELGLVRLEALFFVSQVSLSHNFFYKPHFCNAKLSLYDNLLEISSTLVICLRLSHYLAITGTEAMFADLGHFSKLSIRVC